MKKLLFENIKKSFEKEGYKLVSKEYKNYTSKLKFVCPLGHKFEISWNGWEAGNRCLMCSKNRPIKYNDVKKSFEKEGYILLSKKYLSNNDWLNCICPKKHKYRTKWRYWVSGTRCGKCSLTDFLNIKKSFESEKYILLSKKYKNRSHLRYICPKGHKHRISWQSWKRGARCVYCSNRPPITYNFVKESFEKEEYTLLSKKYINARSYLKYTCPRGHKHQITWYHWNSKNKTRCKFCSSSKTFSKAEKDISNHIKSLGIKVIENDRKTIFNPNTGYGLELDIWMPNLKKAIEYNGKYWHTKNPHDSLKKKLCKRKKIKLCVIVDEEWKHSAKRCIKKIDKFLNIKE